MTTFAVTGATGWVGRAAAEVLDRRGEEVLGFASRDVDLKLESGRTLACRPLTALAHSRFDVLLHFAFVTREHAATMGPDAYVEANRAITGSVLDAIATQHPKAVVYASSGAVYGPDGRLASDLDSDPYGVLKLRDEQVLEQATVDARAALIVPRIFNLAGPWLTKLRGFALSDILIQMRHGGPVSIGADGPVERSYADVEDVASLCLALAIAGRSAAFDTAGERVVEVGELPGLAADALGVAAPEVARTWDRHGQANRYVGDRTEFARLAAAHGIELRGLAEQIRRTDAWIGEVLDG